MKTHLLFRKSRWISQCFFIKEADSAKPLPWLFMWPSDKGFYRINNTLQDKIIIKSTICESANSFLRMAIAFWLQSHLATIRNFRKAPTIIHLALSSLECPGLSLWDLSMHWLCWELISQLGPPSECDPFNCRIQKAKKTWEEVEWPPIPVPQPCVKSLSSCISLLSLSTAAAMEPTLFHGWKQPWTTLYGSYTHNPSNLTEPGMPFCLLAVCPLNSRSSISVKPFPLWIICFQKSFNPRSHLTKKFAEEVWHQPHWGVISWNCELIQP